MDITLFGISLREPSTMFSDWLISGVCFFAAFRFRLPATRFKEIRFLRYFFILFAFSTFLGGLLGHGLQGILPFAWKTPSWVLGMCAVTFFEFMILERMIQSGIQGPWKTLAVWMPLKLAIFIILALILLSFHAVEAQSVTGIFMLALPLEIMNWRENHNEASRSICLAIFLSTCSALVNALRISIHPDWFTHMDFAHLLLAVASWFYYLAGKSMVSRHEAQSQIA